MNNEAREDRMNKQNGVLRAMEVLALVFSVVTGGSSVGLLIWKGGSLAQQVTSHEGRLMTIESRGSPPIAEHIKLDDERNERTKERLVAIERVIEALEDLRITQARMAEKLDNIDEALKRK